MLPPFHGDRMRAYESVVRETPPSASSTRGRVGRAVRGAPEDAGDHARGDPARGLRRVRAPGALHELLRDLLSRRPSRRHCRSRCCSAAGSRSSACRRRRAEIDARLLAEIAARRAAPGEDICSLLVQARFEDGTGDERPRGPRPADDAAARRARDDRDRAGVDARPAHAPPATCSSARGPEATSTCARSSPSRCGCARSSRSRAAGSPSTSRADGLHLPAGHRRHARDLARPHPPRGLPGAVRVPARALPRAPAVDLHVDPVRRRRAPLPRRGVRRDGDAGRARGDPARASTCAPPRAAPSASPAATSRSPRATARA